MGKVIRLTERDLTRLIKRVIKEENVNPGIVGTPEGFFNSPSKEANPKLGIPRQSLNSCFKYSIESDSPTSFGVGKTEMDNYIDYLGVYGKVPFTNIPIPYQGDDLKQMIYTLEGSKARNVGAYGPVEDRTSEFEGGIIYPAVEVIRANYTRRTGESLAKALGKKLTDSEEDTNYKAEIKSILIGAYKKWIDCANGVQK